MAIITKFPFPNVSIGSWVTLHYPSFTSFAHPQIIRSIWDNTQKSYSLSAAAITVCSIASTDPTINRIVSIGNSILGAYRAQNALHKAGYIGVSAAMCFCPTLGLFAIKIKDIHQYLDPNSIISKPRRAFMICSNTIYLSLFFTHAPQLVATALILQLAGLGMNIADNIASEFNSNISWDRRGGHAISILGGSVLVYLRGQSLAEQCHLLGI